MGPNGVSMLVFNLTVYLHLLLTSIQHLLTWSLIGANGVKMKIWQCFSGLVQQTWTPVTTSGTIKLTTGDFCLDLTNGNTDNKNVLQVWTCTAGDTNQIWSVTSA
jgi:hypothetical protein